MINLIVVIRIMPKNDARKMMLAREIFGFMSSA